MPQQGLRHGQYAAARVLVEIERMDDARGDHEHAGGAKARLERFRLDSAGSLRQEKNVIERGMRVRANIPVMRPAAVVQSLDVQEAILDRPWRLSIEKEARHDGLAHGWTKSRTVLNIYSSQAKNPSVGELIAWRVLPRGICFPAHESTRRHHWCRAGRVAALAAAGARGH